MNEEFVSIDGLRKWEADGVLIPERTRDVLHQWLGRDGHESHTTTCLVPHPP